MIFGEHLFDGHQGGLRVQRIEDRFDEEEIDAPRDQGANLAAVISFDLIKGDDPKTGVICIRRN